MPLPVSQAFKNAQAADANKPVATVQLVLGNYASASGAGAVASSSGDDASGNFPASGAIDGDRTELNVGAASGADNGVGLSSWKSSVAPDSIFPTPVYLNVNFGTSRTINRIKLYHLSGHSLKTFTLQYWNGSAFVNFASTAVGATPTDILTTGRVDVITFPDIVTSQVRLNVFSTQVPNDPANVVELEVYRAVDISSRIQGIAIKRQRDYKLANPLAAQVELRCINVDRFFSPSYVPTTDEVAAGFVNSELGPNVGVLVSTGFNYNQAVEQVQLFTGLTDRISVNARTREATITARDGMKQLINQVDSSRLKTTIDIGSAITYMLNRGNISTFETAVDMTGINIDYFFTDQENLLTVIRDLAQASGDSTFFFDEGGVATYKFYVAQTTNSKTWTSEADFEAGTLTNIATKFNDALLVPILFSPTAFDGTVSGNVQIDNGHIDMAETNDVISHTPTSFTAITTATAVAAPFTNSSGVANVIISVTIPATTSSGSVNNVTIWDDSGGHPNNVLFSGAGPTASCNVSVPNGATVWIGTNPGSVTAITWARANAGGPQNWISGQGKSLVSGVWVNTHDTADNQDVSYNISITIQGSPTPKTGTWTSPVHDTLSIAAGTNLTATISTTYPANTSGSITFYGSADGVTFDVNYTQANPNGTFTIVVASRRYWKAVLTLSSNAFTAAQPSSGPPSFYWGASGTWISASLDTGVSTVSFGTLSSTFFINNSQVTFFTRSSPDSTTWSPWITPGPNGAILSPLNRYLEVRADMTLTSDFSISPEVDDITVTWLVQAGHPKYPTTSSITVQNTDVVLDIDQELADNLGGDTSIINDYVVQAQPFSLQGSSTDTTWQGTIGTPPAPISAGTPLAVSNGQTLTFKIYVPGGMDTSAMSGANPSAAVVTFGGGATGTWSFTSIHPTRPVLQVVITHNGTITDLRVVGKHFSSNTTLLAQQATDTTSIAKYGDRQQTISNKWIVSTAIAARIASGLVAVYKSPVAYIPRLTVRPTFSAQLGDRVTVVDDNTGLHTDFAAVEMNHQLRVSLAGAEATTDMTLLQIPM